MECSKVVSKSDPESSTITCDNLMINDKVIPMITTTGDSTSTQPMIIYVQPDSSNKENSTFVLPYSISSDHSVSESQTNSNEPSDSMITMIDNCDLVSAPLNENSAQSIPCLATVQTPEGPVYIVTYGLANQEETEKLLNLEPFKHVICQRAKGDEEEIDSTSTNEMEQDVMSMEDRYTALNAMVPPPVPRKRSKLKTKADDREYSCDLCDRSFATAPQYYGHLNAHSGEKTWSCMRCDKHFPTQSTLLYHEKTHTHRRPHECKDCGKTFVRQSQRNYHIRRVHQGEKSFLCQVCGKGFFKRSDLRSHLQLHLGIKPCICEVCGKAFSHVSNLLRHARTHTGVKPYVCNICGHRFSQVAALHHHKSTHKTSKNSACDNCDKTFRSPIILRKHVKAMHSNEPTKTELSVENHQYRRCHCHVCGETFEFTSQLREHEDTHKKQENFYCRGCLKIWESSEELKHHSCVSIKPVITPETNDKWDMELTPVESAITRMKHSQNMVTLHLHMEEGPVKALRHQLSAQLESLIQESIMGGTTMYEHDCEEVIVIQQQSTAETIIEVEKSSMLVIQDTNEDKIDDNTDDIRIPELNPLNPPVICEYNNADDIRCSLLDANLLVQPVKHQVTTVPVKVEILDNVISEPIILPTTKTKPAKYLCKECNKVFSKSSNYHQHLGIHFVELQKYCCSVCGSTFAWKSTLNKHLQLHQTEPLPTSDCNICSRPFHSNTLMQDHIRRDHYKERPHMCPHCGKTFFKKYDLTVHIRTHTKERPYVCVQCGKAFSHLSHIIRHERIHSGEKPYECRECGRRFNQSTSLKNHRQKHLRMKEDVNVSDSKILSNFATILLPQVNNDSDSNR